MSLRARWTVAIAVLVSSVAMTAHADSAPPDEASSRNRSDLLAPQGVPLVLLSRLASGAWSALTCDRPSGCGEAAAMAIPVVGRVVAAAETRDVDRGLAVGMAIAEAAALTVATIAYASGEQPGQLRLALRPTGVAISGTY